MDSIKRTQRHIRNTELMLDTKVNAKHLCHGLGDLGRFTVPL